PRLHPPRPVQIPRFSRPIRSRTRLWPLVFVGSSSPQRLPRGGWSSPNGSRPSRCARCWAGSSTVLASGRSVCTGARMPSSSLATKANTTATPTAAVVLALVTQVALVQLWLDAQELTQFSGGPPYPLLVCEALGLDSSGYAVPSGQKNDRDIP